jgi:hypothetical protein
MSPRLETTSRRSGLVSPGDVEPVVRSLLDSPEPAIRWKVRVGFLNESPDDRSISALRDEIRRSPLVAALLQRRGRDGRLRGPVYAKWQGAHWVMATLADIGHPPGDEALLPLRDQLQEHWLDERFHREFPARSKAEAYRNAGVPVMQNRHRRCASQQANALWSILRLDLADSRTHDLVERLLHWQWPDGGWNCDKNPDACRSSFMESILPLRALALYADRYRSEPAQRAARRAAEVFLKRRLFLRESDGTEMRREFTDLHYPCYWHYDILLGLKVMAESGFIGDARCDAALQLLARKQLPGGGWPAEKKYYRASSDFELGNDWIDWGGTSRKAANPWVTADVLHVLAAAGCIGRGDTVRGDTVRGTKRPE